MQQKTSMRNVQYITQNMNSFTTGRYSIIQHTVGADCLGNGSSKMKSTHLLEWLWIVKNYSMNGCKQNSKSCKSFSYCKPPESLFIWSTFAGFVFRLFQTPEVGLMDTLRYKLVSQGTLQVTEVDNAWFSHVDMVPFTLSD